MNKVNTGYTFIFSIEEPDDIEVNKNCNTGTLKGICGLDKLGQRPVWEEVFIIHHAAYCWPSEESAAAALWEQSTADHAVPLQNTKTQ